MEPTVLHSELGWVGLVDEEIVKLEISDWSDKMWSSPPLKQEM